MLLVDCPSRWQFLLLFGLFLLLLSPSVSFSESPVSPPLRPNIVIVSMDTTRADHLSLYGHPLPTTPHLDRFAKNALVFEQASTVVPLTGPSHASLFTSLFPHRHGAFRNGISLQDASITLAEHLKAHGYDTAAFVSGWTLREKICGLAQGFDLYDDRVPHRYKLVNRERFAAETNEAVFHYLNSRRESQNPLFLFVHYFDPHAPYRRHPENWDALKRFSAEHPADDQRPIPTGRLPAID